MVIFMYTSLIKSYRVQH